MVPRVANDSSLQLTVRVSFIRSDVRAHNEAHGPQKDYTVGATACEAEVPSSADSRICAITCFLSAGCSMTTWRVERIDERRHSDGHQNAAAQEQRNLLEDGRSQAVDELSVHTHGEATALWLHPG